MLGPPFTEGVIRALTSESFSTSEHLRFGGFARFSVRVFQEEMLRTAEQARFVAAARRANQLGRPTLTGGKKRRVGHLHFRPLTH